MILASVFIGVLLYAFYFIGLRHTTAGNASIMSLMEVFFSFLILGVVIKHESLRRSRILGAVCMVVGAVCILLPRANGWHSGDLFILLGTAFPPMGNMYVQKARKKVSAVFIMFVRSVIAGCCLLVLAFLTEPMPASATIIQSIDLLLLNGIVFMGLSKILWIEALRFIPITKAISLSSVTPVCTMTFAYFILHEHVTAYQIFGFIPIAVGIYFLTSSRVHRTSFSAL